jgi:hypothetical protein
VNDSTYRNLLRDVIAMVIERAREPALDVDGFDAGRHAAYFEIVDSIRNRSVAFDVPLADIGLEKLRTEGLLPARRAA